MQGLVPARGFRGKAPEKEENNMGMLDLSIMKKYILTCDDGWHQGWHERNGGNLTYRLKAEEVA